MRQPLELRRKTAGNVADTLTHMAAEIRGFILDNPRLAEYRRRQLAEMARGLDDNAGVLRSLEA